ncbi:Site-specific DNA-methyltransferase (adenine-specific) [Methanolacinia petrolearia DSM 11571]|uniref:site-specific DNA-methyltransferase (adenine-specific) n=1 Tax=Methanolacinia petrolearia (strain DSM 11571 / OCM 486 / SEBR 4847) TaxID=679926 RepID=E1RHC3_METP4|nr:class I SAM-dependent DNA methyltransferase [Methanolacinia petrolearia]ADN36427.1 Site-specific DNA-methyltransferase (adenine-specific) [Methanolacinia petrolearia DSM 11571]
MAENNSANIGFEQEIWSAACVLRGNMDASEYKHVVLGLIFLKYISDKFEQKYNALKEEGDGFEEDEDEYLAEGIFYVPPEARWDAIAKKAHTPEIGTTIDDAMRAIEKKNKRLKDILPKTFARPELDKRRLGEVVDLFTNIQMADHGDSKDILGRAYEYCLAKFAEQEGKLAGEFYTPACVVKTIVEVLQPCQGRVYDPCCGSGGMFVQSAIFIENHRGNINNISVYGQDSNPTTWKMAQMNLAIRGIEADLGKFSADTFYNDLHPTLKADFIMANPPFNLSNWGADKLADDPRWKYGIPPSGNANFAWMQHMIYHLAPKGRLGLVLANGSLSSQSGGEGEIRKNIVEADLVECIVAMPPQLFYTTQIPVSLWFINRDKKQKRKTLFIDARNKGEMRTRKLRELTQEEIELIGKTVSQFEAGTLEEKKGFSAVVSTEDIAKQDYILTPGRYVGIADVEDDGEPFEQKMERLTGELSELFVESKKAEEEIRRQLKSVGFEV